jgi:hypothetical protein
MNKNVDGPTPTGDRMSIMIHGWGYTVGSPREAKPVVVPPRHCERSEAISIRGDTEIASSLRSSQ